MNENSAQPPVQVEARPPGLPQQNQIRRFLRIAGPVILCIGFLCLIASMVSLFSSFGGLGPPRFFWLGFVGLPLMFVGGVLCSYGFMGLLARFMAGETAPVAAETANYLATETSDAVKTVSKAVAEGVVEGIEAARNKPPVERKD